MINLADEAQKIQELTLEEVMGDRFGRYSKYIIQERALPDIRDGLKPVQRRILYAMAIDGNTYDKGFRKSAKSVGNVMGNFHPHGDSSIYEAMVRLSQDWKLREPLIEMHGNNGSMDGDPPAAMRYTEARLSKIASEMLKDIDKKTVDFVLNFDDTAEEPTVLPARFPNLLVNGATGISAGYATEIPPHNLGEVTDGLVYLIDHPDATLEKMMTFVKGPDFPTGGILQGLDGIKKAYETGRGRVVVRAKTSIQQLRGNREQIVVSEIPYEVNKAQMVKKIDELRVLKKVDGISEVRDESDRMGLSVVIELKKQADSQGILNYLFKNTDLQITYNFNMVAISDMQPKQVGLLEILHAYLKHQEEVVTRRTQYSLQKAQDRLHIVAGLVKALSILDQVISTIRASKNKKDAKTNLVAQYDFTEAQAEAIVSLQLYRLTNTDVTALEAEAAELKTAVEGYQAILGNPKELARVIKSELKSVVKAYRNDRKTEIEAEIETLEIDTSVTVIDETVMVAVSHDGYLKRSSLRSYQASEGADGGLKEGDFAILQKPMQTLDQLMLFTNSGHLIQRPVHEIADLKWKEMGEHISQSIGLAADEAIIAAFSFTPNEQNGYFVIGTTDGYIKQTAFQDLLPSRTYRSKAQDFIKLHAGANVTNVYWVSETDAQQQAVFSASYNGYGLSFALNEVSVSGAKAGGVKLMDLKDGDHVANFTLFDPTEKHAAVAIITQRGAFKRMFLSEIGLTSRARRGVLILRELKRDPHRVAAMISVAPKITLLVKTEQALLTIEPQAHATGDRYSNGSFVMDVEEVGQPVFVLAQSSEPISNHKD